jgi:sec-independent protein translocase protein TatA
VAQGLRSIGMIAMGSMSIWHWMLFGAIVLLLFGGKGKISDIMGDVAKGMKSFKKGMSDEDEPVVHTPPPSPRTIERQSAGGVDIGEKHNVS